MALVDADPGAQSRAAAPPIKPQVMTSAEAQATFSLVRLAKKAGIETAGQSQAFYNDLRESTDAMFNGSMQEPQRMLMAQALTLQAVFTQWLGKASNSGDVGNQEVFLRLALRAQSNCRTTLEALQEMKHPKQIAFVRQVNNAHGPQQINNGTAPAQWKKEICGTKLIEELQHGGTQLDIRPKAKAARRRQGATAVDKLHRATDAAR